MKVGILEIAPELAAEAFALLRDNDITVLGSEPSAPTLRVVVSHDGLPAECEHKAGGAVPVVRMLVITEVDGATRRFRLSKFTLDPWAAPLPPRRRAR